MWMRGIRESNDLDVICRGSAWEQAQTHGKVQIKENGLECVRFAEGNIEIYRDWDPGKWNIDELIDTAEIVDGIPFARLDFVIDWKKKMGREKDQKDLALIKKYLSKNTGII